MKKFLCCLCILITVLAFNFVQASNTFYDTRGTKYEGVVERMAKLGIINGMSETTYAPNKGVTRAELAKILTKMRGIEDYTTSVEYNKIFKDVKKSDWFYPYIEIVSDLELINGYEDGTFKPNKEVTYAELVVLLLRNLGYSNISEEHPNGWYWNYITKMRELELNDNIGEFDYNKPAKRGDVAMFVWNALITDRWAIAVENSITGFTYTYSAETPLEIFFDEYNFIDNQTVASIAGFQERIAIVVNGKKYFTDEKTPLYALGGKITALYEEESKELIGVTFDEDYDNLDVASGPEFYLKEQGYRFSSGIKTSCFGNKDDANYVYLVINKNTNQIIRAVYVDTSKTVMISAVDKTKIARSGDFFGTIIINEEEIDLENATVYTDGFKKEWSSVNKEDIITNLGNGLYAKSNLTLTDTINKIVYDDDYITLGDDRYMVSDNCMCQFYKEKERVEYNTLSNRQLKNHVGKEATVKLNVAEEIVYIEFGKTDDQEEQFKIGFVTEVKVEPETKIQSIKIDYGKDKTRFIEVELNEKRYYEIGELVAINSFENNKAELIDQNKAFDNDIAVMYNYDAKKFSYPIIGEYLVTEDTEFYKVNMEYEDNSISKVKNCNVELINLGEDIDILEAYTLHVIYNENMEIVRVFAINDINKFEKQIGLVREIEETKDEHKEEYMKITLSIVNDAVRGFKLQGDYENMSSGDIITFEYDEETDSIITKEVFKKEYIGFKRDLVVEEYNRKENAVVFKNANSMYLDKELYDWNGRKINLNKYRFVIAEVNNINGYWEFTSLEMKDKEQIVPKKGDRFAIGELQDIIVIYRGY